MSQFLTRRSGAAANELVQLELLCEHTEQALASLLALKAIYRARARSESEADELARNLLSAVEQAGELTQTLLEGYGRAIERARAAARS